jgi:methyltransferase (TIGR00027 family)
VLTTELGLVEQTPPQAVSRQRARGARALLRRAPRKQRRGLIEVAHWAFGASGYMKVVAWSDGPGLYPVIRARFFDDFLLDSCRRLGVRQIVLAAAGLDTRAFRLDWPPRTRLYEMDLPEVLNTKEDVIGNSGATPNCERITVAVDLQEASWPERLVARGYRPDRHSVWLIEGLFYYLTRLAVDGLLDKVRSLTAANSPLGFDVMNQGLFFSPAAWPMRAALAQRGAPGRFGTDHPETLMARHGFEADVTQPGEADANFGRWPTPILPREVPGVPGSFLVRARRS